MWKIVKRFLFVILLLFIGASGVIGYIGCQMAQYYSDEGVFGEVVVLQSGDIRVGDVVPLVFVVPTEYEDLSDEMWECYPIVDGKYGNPNDFIIENVQMEETYTDSDVQTLFSNAPVDIRVRASSHYKYTSRIALFIPKAPGDYQINVFGYYRSTSPQGYGGIKVTVLE